MIIGGLVIIGWAYKQKVVFSPVITKNKKGKKA